MSAVTKLLGTIPAVIGSPGAPIEGTDAGEWVLGTETDDTVTALGGDDFVQGLAGNDQVDAGEGNDTVLAGDGDDTLDGNVGDDVLRGDAGADTFVFDPSREEGADTVVDFNATDGDVIAISAAGLALSGADLEGLSGATLDDTEGFDIVGNDDGDVEIQHPGGTVTLSGVAFSEELTFASLEQSGQLEITGFIEGTDQGEELTGTDSGEFIDARGGDDTITPGSGSDIIATGEGRDTVNINPSNASEDADVITDFTAPSALDPTLGDFINFALADLLESDPDLPAADGDATTLSLADFDASDTFTLGASEDGEVLMTHPGGSVEFSNITFRNQVFANLGPVIKVDGEEFAAPIPVESDGGGDGDGGDGTGDGGDGTGSGGEDGAGGGVDGGGEEPVPEPTLPEEEAVA